jgi:hypothetical protein
MRTAQTTHPFPPAGLRVRGQRRPIAWLLARLRAPWLDRQLAAGVVPWRSRVHAARALQLTSARSRRALARSMEMLVERAERPPTPFRGAAIPPCREQVREAWPLVLAIASRLRSGEPVNAHGVARLRELLSDGAGPCYLRATPDALTLALQSVCRVLDVDD